MSALRWARLTLAPTRMDLLNPTLGRDASHPYLISTLPKKGCTIVCLGCTNASNRPSHLRPTHEGRRCLRIDAASSFFFFFSFHDSRQHGADSGRCALNRVDSRRLRPYQSVSSEITKTTNSGQKKKKKVQNALFGRNNKTLKPKLSHLIH